MVSCMYVLKKWSQNWSAILAKLEPESAQLVFYGARGCIVIRKSLSLVFFSFPPTSPILFFLRFPDMSVHFCWLHLRPWGNWNMSVSHRSDGWRRNRSSLRSSWAGVCARGTYRHQPAPSHQPASRPAALPGVPALPRQPCPHRGMKPGEGAGSQEMLHMGSVRWWPTYATWPGLFTCAQKTAPNQWQLM